MNTKQLPSISVKDLKAKLDNKEALFLLDIREDYERELGYIDSTHVPMAEVAEQQASFPKDKAIIVICRSGRRAEPVCNLLLNDLGFENVSILAGGLLAWKEEIDPTLTLD